MDLIPEADGVFSFPGSHLGTIPTDGTPLSPSHCGVGESRQEGNSTDSRERRSACVATSLHHRFTSSSDSPVVARVELNIESEDAGETPDLFSETLPGTGSG